MRSMKRSGYYKTRPKAALHSCLHENAGMTLGPAPNRARSGEHLRGISESLDENKRTLRLSLVRPYASAVRYVGGARECAA